MNSEPQIAEREPQHYAGIEATVTMESIGGAIDQAIPELFGWLGAHGIEPAGAPIIRFLVIDMMADLRIEIGIPTPGPVTGDERVRPGVLPAGKYAVLRHTGPYDGDDGLIPANAALQDWAREHGVEFDQRATPDGDAWGARVEQYLTNPAEEPDPANWETEVAYLTR